MCSPPCRAVSSCTVASLMFTLELESKPPKVIKAGEGFVAIH